MAITWKAKLSFVENELSESIKFSFRNFDEEIVSELRANDLYKNSRINEDDTYWAIIKFGDTSAEHHP